MPIVDADAELGVFLCRASALHPQQVPVFRAAAQEAFRKFFVAFGWKGVATCVLSSQQLRQEWDAVKGAAPSATNVVSETLTPLSRSCLCCATCEIIRTCPSRLRAKGRVATHDYRRFHCLGT